jgi:hypothetical protein
LIYLNCVKCIHVGRYLWFQCNRFYLQNLLNLNPKIKTFASVVPSAYTKENKLKWKRNANRKCEVSTNYMPLVFENRITILDQTGILFRSSWIVLGGLS